MLERLKGWGTWFNLPRTVGLLLDGAIAYSSWKLYEVVLPLTMGSRPIAAFNAAMFLGFGMIVHRVLRRIGKPCRIVVLLILYGLKLGTAGMFSLAIHAPEVETHKRVHRLHAETPVLSEVPAILISETAAEQEIQSVPRGASEMVDCALYLWESFPADLIFTILLTWFSMIIGDIMALLLEWIHHQVENAESAPTQTATK